MANLQIPVLEHGVKRGCRHSNEAGSPYLQALDLARLLWMRGHPLWGWPALLRHEVSSSALQRVTPLTPGHPCYCRSRSLFPVAWPRSLPPDVAS